MAVEWNAGEYKRQSTLQKTLAGENLAKLVLVGTESVLDVGCGDGAITVEIAARLPQGSALGVDPSTDMVAFAGKHYSRPNLRFEMGDARGLPYRDEFDLVISFNALHWVREQDAALRSIRSALKPGGQAFLQFVPQGTRRSLEDVIEDTRKLPRWAGYFPGFQQPFAHFTPEEYRVLAECAGLQVIDIRLQDGAWDFQTRAAYADFCKATFVEWTRCIPECRRAEFIADVLDSYQVLIAKTSLGNRAENPRSGIEKGSVFEFYQMEVALERPR